MALRRSLDVEVGKAELAEAQTIAERVEYISAACVPVRQPSVTQIVVGNGGELK